MQKASKKGSFLHLLINTVYADFLSCDIVKITT